MARSRKRTKRDGTDPTVDGKGSGSGSGNESEELSSELKSPDTRKRKRVSGPTDAELSGGDSDGPVYSDDESGKSASDGGDGSGSGKGKKADDGDAGDSGSDDDSEESIAVIAPDDVTNELLADMFHELGMLEQKAKNRFKANAYIKAANAMRKHSDRIENGAQALKLDGVGKIIAAKIDEIFATGRLSKLEKMRAEYGDA